MARPWGKSALEFIGRATHRWYILLPGALGGIVWVANLAGVELKLPIWVPWVAIVGSFVLAIFWAFHDLRTERDGRITELEINASRSGETEIEKRERLLKAAHDNLTELDSVLAGTKHALETGRFWNDSDLPAERIREFESAPGSVQKGELYRAAADAHVWIDQANKEARERTATEWASVGQALQAGDKTLSLDDGDRENLQDGIAKIEKAHRKFEELITELS